MELEDGESTWAMPPLRRLRLWDGRAISVVGAVVGRVGMCDGTGRAVDARHLALLPAAGADIDDPRGRFREILCAVDEAHGYRQST
jgi:hypothetical protein